MSFESKKNIEKNLVEQLNFSDKINLSKILNKNQQIKSSD